MTWKIKNRQLVNWNTNLSSWNGVVHQPGALDLITSTKTNFIKKRETNMQILENHFAIQNFIRISSN